MNDRTNAGVRNLRAMFESQNAASPEPRGRSPAGNGVDGSPSRPTSKVRASFVSVVPSQPAFKDLGTTKGVSVNSPQAHRRESFSVSDDVGAGPSAELKQVLSQEKEEREKAASIQEAVPEQAVETRESSRAPPPIHKAQEAMPNLGTIMKGSDFPEEAAMEKPAPQSEEKPAPQPEKKPTPELEKKPAPEPEKKATPPPEEKPATLLVTDAPGDNPDKPVSGVQEEASLKPADPTDAATVAGGQALPPPAENLTTSGATKTTVATPKAVAAAGPKANGASTVPAKAAAKKPSAISVTKASAGKPSSARSPMPNSPGAARLPKTPTTPKPAPATTSATKSPAPTKAQAKPVAKATGTASTLKPSRTSLRASTSSTATAPTTSAASKAKAPVAETKKPATSKPPATSSAPKQSTSTSPGGFKKPKPRSPTRPIRLPSHLTAQTASSAAKHGEEAAAPKVTRQPSTTTRPPPKAAPVARKLASRASLASSTSAVKRPDSRASTKGGADEGFLARMMRPTTSSASKTADKPQSPPRKSIGGRAPVKPKGHESVVAKGKKKVEHVAEKVKDSVTNGHSEEKTPDGDIEGAAETNHHEEKAIPAKSADAPSNEPEASPSEPVADGGAVKEPEPVRSATPVEAVDSSAVELQTPNFEGQTIR